MSPTPPMLTEMGRFDDFLGDWVLEKEIRHADGSRASFQGQAVFEPSEGGLRYLETGALTVAGGAPLSASREYLWNSEGAVFFKYGRFFHKIPNGGGVARHHCPPDIYLVEYVFDAWPDWSAAWSVTGPRKDYQMICRYRRANRSKSA